MADKKALKLYIDQQQSFHNELTESYSTLRTQIVTYIGAILALMAFLYAGALDASKSATERLFIPNEVYGQIFYVAGLFFLLYALGKLIHGSRPNGIWNVGFQSSDVNDIENMTEEMYLLKIKNDNEEARQLNARQHSKKHEAIKDSFYPMLMGAIIMIVLRYFQ